MLLQRVYEGRNGHNVAASRLGLPNYNASGVVSAALIRSALSKQAQQSPRVAATNIAVSTPVMVKVDRTPSASSPSFPPQARVSTQPVQLSPIIREKETQPLDSSLSMFRLSISSSGGLTGTRVSAEATHRFQKPMVNLAPAAAVIRAKLAKSGSGTTGYSAKATATESPPQRPVPVINGAFDVGLESSPLLSSAFQGGLFSSGFIYSDYDEALGGLELGLQGPLDRPKLWQEIDDMAVFKKLLYGYTAEPFTRYTHVPKEVLPKVRLHWREEDDEKHLNNFLHQHWLHGVVCRYRMGMLTGVCGKFGEVKEDDKSSVDVQVAQTEFEVKSESEWRGFLADDVVTSDDTKQANTASVIVGEALIDSDAPAAGIGQVLETSKEGVVAAGGGGDTHAESDIRVRGLRHAGERTEAAMDEGPDHDDFLA